MRYPHAAYLVSAVLACGPVAETQAGGDPAANARAAFAFAVACQHAATPTVPATLATTAPVPGVEVRWVSCHQSHQSQQTLPVAPVAWQVTQTPQVIYYPAPAPMQTYIPQQVYYPQYRVACPNGMCPRR